MYYPGIDYPHSVVRGTQTAYFATDQVGSVSALFDSVGQVLNQYTYEPFGEMETVTEQIVNPLRFTAREYDATTELYYYRNRWYDPHLGRFISEDPIGLEGGINAYAYVGNNPINYADPMGLRCERVTTDHWKQYLINGIVMRTEHEGRTVEFYGDCSSVPEAGDFSDRRGGIRARVGPNGEVVMCMIAIGIATEASRDRRLKAFRFERASRRYEQARSRAQYLNEIWTADTRWGRSATDSYESYREAQREVTASHERMQDARADLDQANQAMTGATAMAVATCLLPLP